MQIFLLALCVGFLNVLFCGRVSMIIESVSLFKFDSNVHSQFKSLLLHEAFLGIPTALTVCTPKPGFSQCCLVMGCYCYSVNCD